MKTFVCGFTDGEAGYIQGNTVCNAASYAADCHHRFLDSGSMPDFDAFMEALAQWRRAETYPFRRAQ